MSNSHVIKDFDWELIREIGKYKILYVPEHDDYRNCKKRHLAWENVSLQLDIHPQTCRKRWGWMKSNFVRYTLGIQEGNNNSRRKTLPYYDLLRQLLEKGQPVDFPKDSQSDDASYSSQVCTSTMEQDTLEEYGNIVESTNNEHQNDDEMNESEGNQVVNTKLENIDLTIDEEDDMIFDQKTEHLLALQEQTTVHDTSNISYSMQIQPNRINHNHNQCEQEIVYEDVSTTQPPPPPQQQQQQPPQRTHNYSFTNSVLEEDECLIAGKRIGFQLKSVEDFQRTIAEKLISDIVYFAKMGNLTENSVVMCNKNNSH